MYTYDISLFSSMKNKLKKLLPKKSVHLENYLLQQVQEAKEQLRLLGEELKVLENK